MKARHIVMAAVLAVAAWLALFGDKTPNSSVAEAVTRSTRHTPGQGPARPDAGYGKGATPTVLPAPREKALPAAAAPEILALLPRETLIGGAQLEKPAAGFFSSHSWTPPPPPPSPPPPPPKPAAPPLPFTYLGKKIEDGIWEIYLGRADQTIIVREGSEIEGLYKVELIKPPMLSLIYLPLKEIQTMPIGGID